MVQRNAFGLVTRLGRIDTKQHRQAAGDEDEGHQGHVGDAVKGSGPVRIGHAQIAVGHQAGGKRRRIGDDEQPHRHFLGGNSPYRRHSLGVVSVNRIDWRSSRRLLDCLVFSLFHNFKRSTISPTATTAGTPKGRP